MRYLWVVLLARETNLKYRYFCQASAAKILNLRA